jgi:hypothetical protein
LSQNTFTEFRCDNCTRHIYKNSMPVGWSTFTLLKSEDGVFEQADLCESCTDAVLSAMAKRKKIEGGRFLEPEQMIHNAPSFETADALAPKP